MYVQYAYMYMLHEVQGSTVLLLLTVTVVESAVSRAFRQSDGRATPSTMQLPSCSRMASEKMRNRCASKTAEGSRKR